MGSALRNRRRTRDPSVSRSMSVEAAPSFAADSGGSWPSSAALLSRLRVFQVGWVGGVLMEWEEAGLVQR